MADLKAIRARAIKRQSWVRADSERFFLMPCSPAPDAGQASQGAKVSQARWSEKLIWPPQQTFVLLKLSRLQRFTNSQTLRAVTVKQLLKVGLSKLKVLLQRQQTWAPVTSVCCACKQAVESSPDDTLKVDGADLHNVSHLGTVMLSDSCRGACSCQTRLPADFPGWPRPECFRD